MSSSVRALIERGDALLPDLEFVGHTPSSVKSSHKEVSIVEGSDFKLCNLPALIPDSSMILACGTHKGMSTGVDFHNEASLETATVMILVDILKALDLYSKFTVQQQVTQDANERGDLVVLTVFGVVLLIVEVKRPEKVPNDLTHRRSLGQNFDYLRINRECASLGYCFGVWTTYKECRIIWLDDPHHNQLAAAERLEPNFKFPLPPDEYAWDRRRVCASKIYKKADNIPMVLACLIWKLYNSALEAKTVLCRSPAETVSGGEVSAERKKPVKYRTVNERGYFFQANSGVIEKLTFSLPSSTTKLFYLIRQYNGRDGKVWLSINRGGRFAMVKFRKSGEKFSFTFLEKEAEPDNELDNADDSSELVRPVDEIENSSSLASTELEVWRRAYAHFGASPFVAKLAGKEALVLPFTFCYKANGELPTRLSSYLPCSDTFGDGLTDWGAARPLLESSAKIGAVENLFSAIQSLAKNSVCHLDIKWEHLALLPVFEGNALVHLEPILIDLAEVDLTLSPTDAFSSMCCAVLTSDWLSDTMKDRFQELMQH